MDNLLIWLFYSLSFFSIFISFQISIGIQRQFTHFEIQMVVVVVWMYTTWTFQQLLHISFQNIESKSSFFYHYRRRSLRLRRFDDRTIFLFLFFSCFHCVPASYFSRFFSTSSSLLLLFWVLQQFSMSSHHHSLRFIFLSRRWLCFFWSIFLRSYLLMIMRWWRLLSLIFLLKINECFFCFVLENYNYLCRRRYWPLAIIGYSYKFFIS